MGVKYIRVPVNPALKERYINQDTYANEYKHMRWCYNNCRSDWYNDSNDYDSICFSDHKEALQFALEWSNLTEEQLILAILKWS